MVDCLQACTAHAASGTGISMQYVVLIVPSPKSLVFSSHHPSLSCTRKVSSLQPTKGLFHIHRRLLSETTILTVHRFAVSGSHIYNCCTCGNVSHTAERLLEDTVRCHGPTSMQALQHVLLSQIPLKLCSKATSHALDRVPGSFRDTHIQCAYTDRNYHGDNSPTPQCKTCTFPRSVVARAPSLQGAYSQSTSAEGWWTRCMVRSFLVRRSSYCGRPINDTKTVCENRHCQPVDR